MALINPILSSFFELVYVFTHLLNFLILLLNLLFELLNLLQVFRIAHNFLNNLNFFLSSLLFITFLLFTFYWNFLNDDFLDRNFFNNNFFHRFFDIFNNFNNFFLSCNRILALIIDKNRLFFFKFIFDYNIVQVWRTNFRCLFS